MLAFSAWGKGWQDTGLGTTALRFLSWMPHHIPQGLDKPQNFSIVISHSLLGEQK